MARWSAQSFIDGPVELLDSGVNQGGVKTRVSAPLRQRLRASIAFDLTARTSIVGLLACGRPPAILRRVGAVVVNALNAVFDRWTRPHVAHELIEVVSPLVADGNSACAIPWIRTIGLQVTPPFHSEPNTEQGCARHAVCRRAHAVSTIPKTAAAFNSSASQPLRRLQAQIAALAATQPQKFIAVAAIGIGTNNGKASKNVRREIHAPFYQGMIDAAAR